MSEFLSRLFGGGEPTSGGDPVPDQSPYADLSPDQRRLLGIAAMQDAFAALAGQRGGALQSVMPVTNMLQQQQNQRRYQEAVSRFASGGEPTSTAAAAAAAGAAAPSAAPVRAPASADETNGPFSRAAIGRALDVLGRAEARGPGVVNSQGYAGQYQIGAPLAADAGVYRPAPGEISRRGEWNGQWGGTFNIPGFENVRTLRDFLENPDAQRRAAELAMQVQAGRMTSMGLPSAIGRNVGGNEVTPEALLQGAWLGGPGGVQALVERGEDRRDVLGTPVSRWMGLRGAQAQAQPTSAQAAPTQAQPAPAGQPTSGAPSLRPISAEERRLLASLPPEIGWRILAERANPTRVGLQPVMVEEPGPNGERVVVPYFPTQTGELRRGQLPPGARVAEGIRTVDMGTGTGILGGRTGTPMGVVPRDTAGREREERVGQAQGIDIAKAPEIISTSNRSISQINEVLNHPAFSTASGVLSPLQNIPGTSAYDFGRRLEQLQGVAFLQAFDSLRGAGAVSNREGEIAQAAIARIKAGLSPSDLRKALDELRMIAEAAKEKGLAAAQGRPAPALQEPSPQSQQPRLRYNPATQRVE
jgi:hypothetical protein